MQSRNSPAAQIDKVGIDWLKRDGDTHILTSKMDVLGLTNVDSIAHEWLLNLERSVGISGARVDNCSTLHTDEFWTWGHHKDDVTPVIKLIGISPLITNGVFIIVMVFFCLLMKTQMLFLYRRNEDGTN